MFCNQEESEENIPECKQDSKDISLHVQDIYTEACHWNDGAVLNPFMPTVAFNICCPRDCVSRHNRVTSGALLKPLRVDSALRALSSLRGLLSFAVSPTANVGTVGKNGLCCVLHCK